MLLDPGGAAPRGGAAALAGGDLPRPPFTLEQLRTFLAVAAREHVTLAARSLGLSQAAVSQQVRLLERSLGVRLLQRAGRNVRLTEAGIEVAAAAFAMMRSAEDLTSATRALRMLQRGSVTIGASELTAAHYLPDRLAAFAAAHPALAVDVVVGDTRDVCEQVAAGALACGLCDGPLPGTGLVRAELAADELLLVAHRTHPLAGRAAAAGRDLAGLTYLTARPDSALEAAAAQLIGPARRRMAELRLPGLQAVRQTLLAGLGVAVLPAPAVAGDLAAGTLVALPLPRTVRLPVYAVRAASPASPAAEALWDVLAGAPGAESARAG